MSSSSFSRWRGWTLEIRVARLSDHATQPLLVAIAPRTIVSSHPKLSNNHSHVGLHVPSPLKQIGIRSAIICLMRGERSVLQRALLKNGHQICLQDEIPQTTSPAKKQCALIYRDTTINDKTRSTITWIHSKDYMYVHYRKICACITTTNINISFLNHTGVQREAPPIQSWTPASRGISRLGCQVPHPSPHTRP